MKKADERFQKSDLFYLIRRHLVRLVWDKRALQQQVQKQEYQEQEAKRQEAPEQDHGESVARETSQQEVPWTDIPWETYQDMLFGQLTPVQKRLAMANVKRWNRLKDAKEHQQRLAQTRTDLIHMEDGKRLGSPIRIKHDSIYHPIASTSRTRPPNSPLKARDELNRSERVTFPSGREGNIIKRAAAKSHLTSLRSTGITDPRYPDPPQGGEGRQNFECPYCHLSLPMKYRNERDLWVSVSPML